METQSFKSLPRHSFIRSTLLCLLFLIRSNSTGAVKSSSELSSVRPEETILKFFTRSFDPEVGTVSPDCQRDAALYRHGLDNYEPWAFQMYDASTKIPSGLGTGNTKQLGNYDECLRVKSDHDFVGKACSAKVRFIIFNSTDESDNNRNEPDMGDLLVSVALASGLINWTSGTSPTYEWLWCVPSSCTPRDIIETIKLGLDPLKKSPRINFTVDVGNESCHTEHSDRWIFDPTDWLYISLLILFGSLVTMSTLYDLMIQKNPEKPDRKGTMHMIMISFSAYKNGKNLLSTQRVAGSVDCLDGVRFLSICWIIYCHTYYLKIVGVSLDVISVAKMHENWTALLLLNGNIATDTLLLLSGCLLAKTQLTLKEKNFDRFRFSVWNLYIRRYLRLTPAYAMVIGFYATLFYKLGSGPHWDLWVGDNRNHCQHSWWTNLLYVNNYVQVSEMCISQSWYLAVDMQLVWISPLFLYPMLGNGKRKQLVFLAVLTTGFLASILVPLLITYFNELTGTMLYYKNQEDVTNVYLQIYTRAYTRAGPYLLGIGLGYLLKKMKLDSSPLPKKFTIAGWTLTIVAGLAVLLGPRGMYFPEHEYDRIEAAMYAGFHRPVFALAVAWIIFASVSGCAGPVGAFLSWNFWAPLSKLTYSAYLTQYIILLYMAGNIRTPEYLTTFGVVQSFFGTLVTTLTIAVILSLTFEIPFIRLMNLWTLRSCRSSTESTEPKSVFETSDSTLEIYRAFDDEASTVSRTYQNLIERYGRVSVDSRQSPECLYDEKNSTGILDSRITADRSNDSTTSEITEDFDHRRLEKKNNATIHKF